MGAGDKLRADQCAFGAKDLRIEFFQLAAANVILGIARGRIEMCVRYPHLAHGIEHLQRIRFSNCVNLRE